MDELVIDEKKYVSTKHAAKLTGYAKDYVGQLCREGRVPARLVGRSWYVLESAIQDHRFGAPQEAESKAVSQEGEPQVTHTWEAPRYESAEVHTLPPISRQDEKPNEYNANDTEETEEPVELVAKKATHTSDELDSAWQDWFAQTPQKDTEDAQAEDSQEDAITEVPLNEVVSDEQEEAVAIPIHSIYPVEEVEEEPAAYEQATNVQSAPIQTPVRRDDLETYIRPVSNKGRSSRVLWAMQGIIAVIALVLAFSAVLSSGVIDTIAISFNQVHILAGVSAYNK